MVLQQELMVLMLSVKHLDDSQDMFGKEMPDRVSRPSIMMHVKPQD